MPNNYLSVLYKHIIQVENKNEWLKVWGGGSTCPLAPPPPHTSLHTVHTHTVVIQTL